MADQFTKNEDLFFETLVEEFEPNNLHANQATVRQASTKYFDKNGVQERREAELMAATSSGRDIAGQNQDILEPTVPVSISDADIVNHTFDLNSNELKDKRHRDKQALAAIKKLSNTLDLRVADKVVKQGSIVITQNSEFNDYDSLAKAETELMNREVDNSADRCMNLNPRAARKAASNIAVRESGIDQKSAYERSMVPPVAGFSTHKANVIAALAASAAGATTVSGAGQGAAITVFDSNSTDAADNRYSDLVVNSTANWAVGDAFTIAGVNSVGMISKSDTGSRQTFRVISVTNGTKLRITPAIIPVDGGGVGQAAFGNVNTSPANTAVLTLLNTAAIQPITFFEKDAVEIFTTSCADPDLSATMDVRRATTDSGIEILFAKQSDIGTLNVTYRLSFMASAHVLENQRVGIMLANQAANVGG